MAAHRYWGLNCHANGGNAYLAVCELQGHTTIGGSTNVLVGGTASATGTSLNPPSNAFDNNLGTYWSENPWTNPTRLIYDLGVGVTQDIVEIAVTSPNVAPDTTPTQADWQFSDDGATWTTYFSYSTSAYTGLNQVKTFNNLAGPEVAQYPLIGVIQPTRAQPQVAQMIIIGILSNPIFIQRPQAFRLPCWSPCANVIYPKEY